MPKIILLCLVLVSSLFSLNIYAQEPEAAKAGNGDSSPAINTGDMRYEKSPLNKLGRGIINAGTCWVEFPGEIAHVSKEKGVLEGLTLGAVEGIFTTLMRGLSGAFDIITFIIPPYNKPLMEPEYALQSMEEKFNEYND